MIKKAIVDTKLITQYVKGECDDKEMEFLFNFFQYTNEVFITPQTFTEISYWIKKWLKTKNEQLFNFLPGCEIINLLREMYVNKEEIINHSSLKLNSVADSSLVILADKLKMPLISCDMPLIAWCRKNNIPAFHIQELIYNSDFFKKNTG